LRTCVPGAVKEDTKKKRTKDIKIGNHVSRFSLDFSPA
jgi:hypothetical protein